MVIKTIDINALEWFDRINGNSYFAGTITINFGLPDEKLIKMPFQYGYGDQYRHQAFKVLREEGYVNADDREIYWKYFEDNNIIARYSKKENCKKKELLWL